MKSILSYLAEYSWDNQTTKILNNPAATTEFAKDISTNANEFVKNVGIGAIKIPGWIAKSIANTTTGKAGLGLLGGALVARKFSDMYHNRKERKEEQQYQEVIPQKPVNVSLDNYLRSQRSKYSFTEGEYLNLPTVAPGTPGLPNIQRRATSIAAIFSKRRMNNYHTAADRSHLLTMQKLSNPIIEKREAETGYPKQMGKLTG